MQKVFIKDGAVRQARTAEQVVRLRYDGWREATEAELSASTPDGSDDSAPAPDGSDEVLPDSQDGDDSSTAPAKSAARPPRR